MPTTSECHRQKIGQFYRVVVQISAMRGKPRSEHKHFCPVTCTVTGLCIAMTVAALYCLCLLLLLICGDIEVNPGPRDNNTNYEYYSSNNDYFTFLLQQVQTSVEHRLSNFMEFLHSHADNLCQKMDDKMAKLEHAFDRLASDLSTLQEWIRQDKEDIDELKQNQSHLHERLDQIEHELEELEKDSRRCTLKFFGLWEDEYENSQKSMQMVLDVLNHHSSTRSWHQSDIERAFRIGSHQSHRDSPRPLLVQMHRWGDKIEILTDRELRGNLRINNVKITADLTTHQREEVDYYRRQGKVAYFRRGRLQVEDRHPGPSESNRNRNKDWYNHRHSQREEPGIRRGRDTASTTSATASSYRNAQWDTERRPGQGRRQHPSSNVGNGIPDRHLTASNSQSPRTPPPESPDSIPIVPGSRLYSEVLRNASPSETERNEAQSPPPISDVTEDVGHEVSSQRGTPASRTVDADDREVQPSLINAAHPAAPVPSNKGQTDNHTSSNREDLPKQQGDTTRVATEEANPPSSPPPHEPTINPPPSLPPSTPGAVNEDDPESTGDTSTSAPLNVTPSTPAPRNITPMTGESPGRRQRSSSSPPLLNVKSVQNSSARTERGCSQQATSHRQTRNTQAQLPTNWLTTARPKNKSSVSKAGKKKK